MVYLAEHQKLHYMCAVKCIPKACKNGKAFLKETEFLKNLRSVYVPVLYDFEEDAEYWYLIEEYISGQSFKTLKQHQKFISQDKLLEIAVKICEAIAWLHNQKPYPVLYMDLKPEHVILTDCHVKLLDMGGAVYLRQDRVSGLVAGTVGFASPEQLRGEHIDVRSDIYSIGAVLYWAMTGETIGNEGRVKKVRGYSAEWNQLVSKCLEREKEKRYVSVESLLTDLKAVKSQKRRRQFEKSLKIAVIGSQRRIGTTHFSIGISIYCGYCGIPVLYEEKNESGTIQEIVCHSRQAGERDGIYLLQGFEAVPKYGNAVRREAFAQKMLIQDYGVFQNELREVYEEADCMIAIAGGQEWEIRYTKELIERYRKREPMYVVLRARTKAHFRQLVKELGLQKAYYMPAYANPYQLSKNEQVFYQTLLEHITGQRIRSITGIEKIWKTRL